MKIKLLFIGIVLGFNINSYAQIDTTLIAKNCKFWLLPTLTQNILTYEELNSFNSLPLEINFLDSEGFKDLVFFKVQVQDLVHVVNSNGDIETLRMPFPVYAESYIFAYYTRGNSLFRISGFKTSDFSYLIKNKSMFLSVWASKKKRKLKKQLKIEGVEIEKILGM